MYISVNYVVSDEHYACVGRVALLRMAASVEPAVRDMRMTCKPAALHKSKGQKQEQDMAGSLSIGVIGGGGWLAQTIIRALLEKGVLRGDQLAIAYRSQPPEGTPAALLTANAQDVVEACDTIIISVRPADFAALNIKAVGKPVISVMAGVSLARIAEATGSTRVIRAMPNVAASIGRSYTPLFAAAAASAEDRATARSIFEACGLCDEMASEDDLDYLTGLTGSGPAFPALLAQALAADAMARGIAPAIAHRAVKQLIVGAGRLIEAEERPMAGIVEEFVAYRGVIAAGIEAMRQAGFDSSVQAGLAAARRKVATLA